MAGFARIHIAGDVMVCLPNVQFICFLLHSLIPQDAHVHQSAQPLCGLIWNSTVLFFSRIRATTKTVNKTLISREPGTLHEQYLLTQLSLMILHWWILISVSCFLIDGTRSKSYYLSTAYSASYHLLFISHIPLSRSCCHDLLIVHICGSMWQRQLYSSCHDIWIRKECCKRKRAVRDLCSHFVEPVTMCWRTRTAEEHFKSGAKPRNHRIKRGGEEVRTWKLPVQRRLDLLIHKWIKQGAADLVAGHRCVVAGRSRNRAEGHHSRDGEPIYRAANRQKRTFWPSCSSSDFKNKNKTRCKIGQAFRSCDV